MFFLTYIRRELRRRAGRTVLTVLGLALGVGLVAAITSISDGLDQAQRGVLDPLGSVGTDLLVTRPVDTNAQTEAQPVPEGALGGFGPGAGFGAQSQLSAQDREALLEENESVITDLSKLGKPGERFVHDYFLPATQLTFPSEQVDSIAEISGVQAVGQGLTLFGVHQEGTVPEIVAEIQTGGETVTVEQDISPPTPEEAQAIRECFERQRSSGQSGFGGCLPERLRRFRGTFRTPQRTITQALNPPQTDITSQTYTIAGVDASTPELGLITEAQLTSGSFLESNEALQVVVADAYAQRVGLTLGDTVDLNGTVFTVVGLAKPPLGGQAADLYVALPVLQTLSNREGRANVLLVRATDAGAVKHLQTAIAKDFPGATITSAEEVASKVSGSLVDAKNLAGRLGLVLSIVLLVAAFLIAALLTLASIAKRVRELGTLKAIGWRKALVVRQVLGESLLQGALGGVIGVGLGIAAAFAIAAFVPPLQATATATNSSAGAIFGLGNVAASGTQDRIALSAPISAGTVLLAFGLALLGGLLAGGIGAWRAARLRPADALREIG